MNDPQSGEAAYIRPVAIVLSDRPFIFDPPALEAAIRSRHPGIAVEMIDVPQPTSENGSLLLRCAGDMVALLAMPGPALPHRTDPAWLRAAPLWPQAFPVVEGHRAHALIAGITTRPRRLEAVRTLSAIAGALIASSPGASAVLWDGQIARSAEMWLELSRAAFAPYPDYPTLPLIDIVPFRSGESICAVTVGLAAFVGREIEYEFAGTDFDVLESEVIGLAGYLIEHGPVVHDGDTVGGSETERTTVRHRTSARFAGLPVLHVTSPPAGPLPDDLPEMFTAEEVTLFVGLPPRDGGVLPSYIEGIRGIMADFEQSPAGRRAVSGDSEAARNLAGRLREVQQNLHAGILTEELFPFSPEP